MPGDNVLSKETALSAVQKWRNLQEVDVNKARVKCVDRCEINVLIHFSVFICETF